VIHEEQRGRNHRKRRWRIGASVAVIALLGFATSCGPPGAERDPGPEDDINTGSEANEQGDSAGSERETSIRQLVENPEEFYGERVTVSATVARVVQPKAFTLVSDEPESDEEPVEDQAVLVVSGGSVASGLSEEQSVRVQGKVRPFKLKDVERELGVDLRDSLRADYAGETPAILAAEVRAI
jgi:hypothetical protein